MNNRNAILQPLLLQSALNSKAWIDLPFSAT
jgi:hypothetical protein